MNPVDPAAALQSQTQALLDLVEQDHSRQAAALAEQTRAAIDAVRRQAFSQARTEMRQAFAEQRRLQQDGLAAPVFACDAGLQAGLKLAWRGNVVDGTLQGLLGEPAELQARLLHELRERTS